MKKLISLVLCFVMLFALSGCNNKAFTDKLDSLENELSTLKDEVSSLKDENTSLREELDSLNDKANSELPDFADCEIGYQLQVYPACEFKYKISDDCIVIITSITAELTAKNTINSGDVLDEAFYPFEITIIVKGNASSADFEPNQGLGIFLNAYTSGVVVYGNIPNDGFFEFNTKFSCYKNFICTFYKAEFMYL